MFRAQLSREELALLAFNMLLSEEGLRMTPLVAKYGLIKHLPKNKLRQEAESKLEPLVFGRKFAHAKALTRSSEGVSS